MLQISARTSVESPEEYKELSHQVRDNGFIESSSNTRRCDISEKKEFQEQCIIPDQQNMADEIQQLCSGDQVDPSIGSEVLLENISQEFSA